MTKILIKKLNQKAIIPKYETLGASGLDLSANLEKNIVLKPGEKCLVPTGIAVTIPNEYEFQIRPRSGLAMKNSITVLNTPGTIDADYRGEIKVIIINLGNKNFEIANGTRIAQMVLCPISKAKLLEVDDLDNTTRGDGGFGSTGS
tara:strand:+ start:245 stop:682 length:438 start_codon:yes stop_codon:yes gene_type:complete